MEEKLFELMAQAEDLQNHAAKLQKEAQEVFSALPLAVEQSGREIRGQATRWLVIVAAVIVALGVVVGVGVSAYIQHDVGSLRAEADALRAEISSMEKNAAELAGKTWRLELVTWKDERERGIILPKGVKFVRSGPLKDGREAIVIKP